VQAYFEQVALIARATHHALRPRRLAGEAIEVDLSDVVLV